MAKNKGEKEFYSDSYFDKAKENVDRLKELEEKEFFLKKEKIRLLKEKPWYKKPQNLIAVFGILLPIIVTLIISFYNKDKKELTIEYYELEPLIVESSNFGNKVSIKYDSTEIKNISRIKFRIFNSGDLDIEKLDFIDGPLNISIISKLKSSNIKIYKVLKINDAGQQNSVLNFEALNVNGSFSYLPSLLNKEDEVVIHAYLIDPSDFHIEISGKIKNGKIKGPKFARTDELQIGYSTLILSINSFFKYKWISVIFFVFLFIITGLSTIYIFAKEEKQDPLWMSRIMAITIGLISILIIAIIISTIIYI